MDYFTSWSFLDWHGAASPSVSGFACEELGIWNNHFLKLHLQNQEDQLGLFREENSFKEDGISIKEFIQEGWTFFNDFTRTWRNKPFHITPPRETLNGSILTRVASHL